MKKSLGLLLIVLMILSCHSRKADFAYTTKTESTIDFHRLSPVRKIVDITIYNKNNEALLVSNYVDGQFQYFTSFSHFPLSNTLIKIKVHRRGGQMEKEIISNDLRSDIKVISRYSSSNTILSREIYSNGLIILREMYSINLPGNIERIHKNKDRKMYFPIQTSTKYLHIDHSIFKITLTHERTNSLTEYSYDSKDHLISIIPRIGSYENSYFSYLPNGFTNTITITSRMKKGSKNTNYVYHFKYRKNNIIKGLFYDVHRNETQMLKYQYDKYGRLNKKIHKISIFKINNRINKLFYKKTNLREIEYSH